MTVAWTKVVTTEMERGGQTQNKFQKCKTNSFADVGYEMKSDVKGDAEFFDLSNQMLSFTWRGTRWEKQT